MSVISQPSRHSVSVPENSPLRIWCLMPLALLMAGLFVAPLLFLVIIGFWRIENFTMIPDLSLANYIEVLTNFTSGSRYGLALMQSIWVAASAALLAVVFAYMTALTLIFVVPPRMRRLALLLAVSPFWSSYVLRLYSWQTILSRNGVINSIFKEFDFATRLEVIYTQTATRIGLIHHLAPILIIILYISLLAVDRVMIEAARELGATRWQTFTRVILPLSRVGLIISGTLAIIVGLGDALCANILGGGAGSSIIGKLPTYASMVMSEYAGSSNLPRISAMATILVSVMMVVLLGGLVLAERVRGGQR